MQYPLAPNCRNPVTDVGPDRRHGPRPKIDPIRRTSCFVPDTPATITDGSLQGRHHRISAQTVPTLGRSIARAAPRDKSMSRPRVNGPRSLIVTTVEAPVRGFVTLIRVPNGSFLCAAVRASGRDGWPLAVPRLELYCVAFIEPLGQLPSVDPAAKAIPTHQLETINRG
jgi:hypothetical protein